MERKQVLRMTRKGHNNNNNFKRKRKGKGKEAVTGTAQEKDARKNGKTHSTVGTEKKFKVKFPKTVSDIALLQSAAGTWSVLHAAQILALPEKEIKDKIGDTVDSNHDLEAAWATVCVVTFLEKNFVSSKGEWKLMVEKANRWVKRVLKKNNFNVNMFMEQAQKFVQSKQKHTKKNK